MGAHSTRPGLGFARSPTTSVNAGTGGRGDSEGYRHRCSPLEVAVGEEDDGVGMDERGEAGGSSVPPARVDDEGSAD